LLGAIFPSHRGAPQQNSAATNLAGSESSGSPFSQGRTRCSVFIKQHLWRVWLEYIFQHEQPRQRRAHLLYGPGSNAWSITVTPTYQYKISSIGSFCSWEIR
jgi:hypothetical protein